MKTAKFQVPTNSVLNSAEYHEGKLSHIMVYYPHLYGGTHRCLYLDYEKKQWVDCHWCDEVVSSAHKRWDCVNINIDTPVTLQIPTEIPMGEYWENGHGQRKLFMDNAGEIQG
jgi:hypothetical protein